ncbi:TRAP transporter small permease [Pseudalkalibacillus caeni]|uniref:TRAP transporter small permease n=1 Tax=Exobacillus caeni TaxID=2574798 RepID=A0A5R9F269_9BACL|nr:TRAP transporter small permease [Pseudalkalibacillus caeni]TLS36580.1 TRAP transporter small permease [Pseudalkalibacillus caeni]
MKMINTFLDRVEEIIVAVSLTIAVALTFTEVILRKFFGSSLGFTQEAVIYLLIIAGLIGASIGVRKKVHLGVDLVIQQYSPKVQKAIVIATTTISVLFCLTFTFLGIEQVQVIATFGQVTPEMEIPLYIPIMVVPISFGLMSFRFIQQLVNNIKTPAEEILQQEEGAH